MGSYHVNCALTNSVITPGEEVVLVLLSQMRAAEKLTCYNWDIFSSVPILIEGVYGDCGRIHDIDLLVTGQVISEKNQKYFKESLLKLFNEKTHTGSVKKYDSLEDYMYADDWVFKSFTHEEKPVLFSFMKKSSLLHILNHFGKTEGKVNDNKSSETMQYLRQIEYRDERNEKDRKSVISIMNFICGSDYCGGNEPTISLKDLLGMIVLDQYQKGNIDKPEFQVFAAQADALLDRQALDFALLNHYFNMLGKTWQPSMILGESIEGYGHKKAYQIQKDIIGMIR